jgi:hypothetical protein
LPCLSSVLGGKCKGEGAATPLLIREAPQVLQVSALSGLDMRQTGHSIKISMNTRL